MLVCFEGVLVCVHFSGLFLSWIRFWLFVFSLGQDFNKIHLKLKKSVVLTYESVDADGPGLAVLLALDLLLDDTGWLLDLLLDVGLLPLGDVPQATLVEHASARQLHHARLAQLGVDRFA